MGTIFKRKSSDGKLSYTARVRKKGFPASNATFSRLTDAKVWIEQEEAKIRQGIHLDYIEAKKHTLAEALDRYIREEKPVDNRRLHLDRWKERLGDLLRSAITEIRINDVTASWRSKGIKTKKILSGGKLKREDRILEPATNQSTPQFTFSRLCCCTWMGLD